jgi:hypothetical protein
MCPGLTIPMAHRLLKSSAAMQINRQDYVRLGTTCSIHVESLPQPARRIIDSDPDLKSLVGRDHVIRGSDFGRLYDRLAELDRRDSASLSGSHGLSRSESLYKAALGASAPSATGRLGSGLAVSERSRQGIFGAQAQTSPLSQGRGGRQAAPRSNALTYDTTTYRLRAAQLPTAPADRAALKTALDAQINQRFRGGYQLSGVQPGSDRELRAMQALADYGNSGNSHNGTESDLLVPTGGVPMRMTVQTDSSGRASATVHASNGVPQPTRTFANVQDATRALQQDFGVRVLQRGQTNAGDSSFTLDELNQVYHGFSQLSASERTNIRGLDLLRTHNAPTRPAGGGDTTGEYNGNVATQNGSRIKPPSITLYDSAFAGNNQAFVGNGTTDFEASLETVLHEAGHAIERQPLDTALCTFNAATDRMNQANSDLAATLPAADAAARSMNTTNHAFTSATNATLQRRGGFTAAQRNEALAFNNASNGVVGALNAMGSATTAQQLTAARTQLQTAVQARDRALAAMSPSNPVLQAAQNAKAGQDAAISAANTTAGARDTFFARKADREAAADNVRQVAGSGSFRVDAHPPTTPTSTRLASFAAMRQRTGEQAVTAYGATGTQEAFAEAYMLFKTDPDYLRANRPQTFSWFDQGNHLR